MIDQTEKSVFDLECAINKLLDENYFTRDYKGFVLYINSLEKYEILHSRLFRDIVQTDGRVDYFYRQPINTSYDHKLPCWANILLYFIACNIDYENICSDPTIRYDSIFNPRYTELLDYISNLMTTNNVNHTHLLFETHTTYIGAYVNENFPIIKKIVDTYSNSKCTDILNSKLTVLMTICFTNSPIKCLLKNEKGFYINSLYINIDGKTYVDKIHLNVVNEDFDEGIQFIAIREITDNEQCIKQRLELKGKNINIDYTIPFYDQLILPNNI